MSAAWLTQDQFSQACAALPLEQAARDESVHPYVRAYAQWMLDNAGLCD